MPKIIKNNSCEIDALHEGFVYSVFIKHDDLLAVISLELQLLQLVNLKYRKVAKFSDTRKLGCNICLKFKQRGKNLGYFVKKMQMEKQTVKTLIRLLLQN